VKRVEEAREEEKRLKMIVGGSEEALRSRKREDRSPITEAGR